MADALGILLQANQPTWHRVLEMISQSFPSGIVELSDQIISRIQHFDWLWDNATLHFTAVFMEAGIPMKEKNISQTDHGLDYLSRIRQRLPESVQLNLLGAEQHTWDDFFAKLQRYQNMIRGDKQRFSPVPLPEETPVLPIHQQTRRSNRNASPTIRYGQNVGYGRNTRAGPKPTGHTTTSPRFPPLSSLHLGPNETAMEKAFHLPTGQGYECFACGRPGHKYIECLVKAVLYQCRKKVSVDPDTGTVQILDRLPLTGQFKTRHDNEWLPFLQGQNALRYNIRNQRDLDTVLNYYNEKHYMQRRNPYKRPANNAWQRTKQKIRVYKWTVPGTSPTQPDAPITPSLTPQTSNTSLTTESSNSYASLFTAIPACPWQPSTCCPNPPTLPPSEN